MLIFWNLCGVPFAYSFQSVFLLYQGPDHAIPRPLLAALFVVLLCAYYVWDTANRWAYSPRSRATG